MNRGKQSEQRSGRAAPHRGSGAAGPHAGQASIRQAYDALGVAAFYATHGSRYTNPHEGQVASALGQLLDATPAAVWLGLQEVDCGEGDGHDSGDSGDEDEPCEEVGGGAGGARQQGAQGARQHAGGGGRKADAGSACASSRAPGRTPCAGAAGAAGADGPGAEAVWREVTAGLAAPVPLRVLDLACGSGEATVTVETWNTQRALAAHVAAQGPSAAGSGAAGGAPRAGGVGGSAAEGACSGGGSSTAVNSTPSTPSTSTPSTSTPSTPAGGGRKRGPGAAAPAVPPYQLHVTACDPFTAAAYSARTGRTAQPWSFEDIAAGCLEELPVWDLVVCSFALHLCEDSRLFATLHALSRAARWLVVLAPHKRPEVRGEHGWVRVRAMGGRTERTHTRVYRSLNAGPGGAAPAVVAG